MAQVGLRSLGAAAADLSPTRGLVAGRPVLALPARSPLSLVAPNTVIAGRFPMTALSAMTGVRFWYGGLSFAELIPDNEVYLEAALEVAGVRYPMTFGGNQFGLLSRFGWLGSDVAPIDIPNGTLFYALTKLQAPNNTANLNPANGYTTLAADVIAGATTITLTDKPLMLANPLRLRIAGAGAEVVEVWKITGTATPYTAFLRTALVSGHTAAGSVVGQGAWTSRLQYSDQITGGSSANTPQFDILTGTFTTPAASASTTLAANANIGDTTLQIVNANVVPGSTFTVDTAGNAETVTARTITGAANPFTVYLTAPLTKNHLSGVAFASTIAADPIPTPTAVTADITTGAPTALVAIGDSIMLGQGNYTRGGFGFLELACDATHPVLNSCKSGESAQQFAANTNGSQRRKLFGLGNWLVYNYGTNDIYGGRTLLQWQTDTQTILGWARARGMKIAMCTITPRTTSTDGWTTATNQTVSNGTFDAVRQAANAWIRAGAGGLCDLVLEVADAVEVNSSNVLTRNGGLYKADTTTGPYTVDGLHPSSAGHTLISAAINPALFV